MYSLHGFDALMRAVFFEVCQRLTVVSYCMPGSPQCHVASEILCSRSRALKVLMGWPSFTECVWNSLSRSTAYMKSSVTRTRVVGVLEEDGRVGVAVGTAAVVTVLDQRPRLGFFLLLALDELHDVGMVDVEDDHLGGAARLAAAT